MHNKRKYIYNEEQYEALHDIIVKVLNDDLNLQRLT